MTTLLSLWQIPAWLVSFPVSLTLILPFCKCDACCYVMQSHATAMGCSVQITVKHRLVACCQLLAPGGL